MLLNAALVIGIALGSQLLGPRVPIAASATVVQLLAGLALGPSGAGLLRVDTVLRVLAGTGMAYLLFTAGIELERRLRVGRARTGALAASGMSAILAGPIALAVSAITGVHDVAVVAVALLTTLVMPTVGVFTATGRSSGELGNFTLLAGTLGEAGAIAVILATAVPTAPAAVVAGVAPVLLAYPAGLMWSSCHRSPQSRGLLRGRLDRVGLTILAPMSFVSAGARIDISAVLRSPRDVVLVPALLLAMVVCRALPARLCGPRRSGPRERYGAGLLLATKLTLVVVAVQLARARGDLSSGAGSALLLSAEITVCAFPAIARSLLARRVRPSGESCLALLDIDAQSPLLNGYDLVKHYCTCEPHGSCPATCRDQPAIGNGAQ